MLTHRKKQQLLYLILGFLLGLIVAAIVVFFGVIRQFTKLQIEKIEQKFPATKDTIVVNVNNTSSRVLKPAEQDSTIQLADTLCDETEMDEIQVDRMINAIRVNMHALDTNIAETKELDVEQWESPMRFMGYKLANNKLIIYGVDITDVEFAYKDDNIYLLVAGNSLLLSPSDEFLHFSGSLFQRHSSAED